MKETVLMGRKVEALLGLIIVSRLLLGEGLSQDPRAQALEGILRLIQGMTLRVLGTMNSKVELM